jgi:hypothetical protein
MRLNELLGIDKYAVYLNSNAFPEDIGDRNVVTMNVTRIPFGFSTEEFDAESMTITLTFDLPCDVYGDDVVVRDGALKHIQEVLLGHKVFNVSDSAEGVYQVNTYFEQQPPSNPYVDSGRITQQIVVSGSALIKSTECGAVVGNDIKVAVSGDYLLKVSRVSNSQVGPDNNIPLSMNTSLAEMTAISRTVTKTLDLIYTGQPIEKEFLKIAEGAEYDINQIYTYRVEYPHVHITTRVKILSVVVQDAPSRFLQYTLTMQIVELAKVTEVT